MKTDSILMNVLHLVLLKVKPDEWSQEWSDLVMRMEPYAKKMVNVGILDYGDHRELFLR